MHSARTVRGQRLLAGKAAQIGELIAVFVVGWVVIAIGSQMIGDNPLARQGVVWVANVLMLLTVWLGLHLRGQSCEHFGLSFRRVDRRAIIRAVFLSFVVFAAAATAFVVGAVVMANIVGVPEGADMSGYNYLRGNLPMLILALVAVYIVSSFGEEVIYRAFLINRIAELGSGSKWAWSAAVVVSSIVFGLVHSEWAVAGMVQKGLAGLVLGVSYLVVGRNLWITILAHGYLDTVLLVQLYLAKG